MEAIRTQADALESMVDDSYQNTAFCLLDSPAN